MRLNRPLFRLTAAVLAMAPVLAAAVGQAPPADESCEGALLTARTDCLSWLHDGGQEDGYSGSYISNGELPTPLASRALPAHNVYARHLRAADIKYFEASFSPAFRAATDHLVAKYPLVSAATKEEWCTRLLETAKEDAATTAFTDISTCSAAVRPVYAKQRAGAATVVTLNPDATQLKRRSHTLDTWVEVEYQEVRAAFDPEFKPLRREQQFTSPSMMLPQPIKAYAKVTLGANGVFRIRSIALPALLSPTSGK